MALSSGGDAVVFTYNGEQIPTVEITNAQPKDGTELAGWLIAHLKVSKYNDVQEIVESRTALARLPELKVFRVQGVRTKATLNVARQQALNATAAHLLMERVNKKPYETCTSKRNRGPFALCVSVGEDTFSGACTNCQYSSGAGKCSLKGPSKKRARVEMVDLDKSSDEDDEVESEAPTPRTKGKHVSTWMRTASTDTLLALVNEIKDELNRRIPH